jgi:outer membrane lipoprotein-sorting protein
MHQHPFSALSVVSRRLLFVGALSIASLAVLSVSQVTTASAEQKLSAAEILKRADDVRNPAESFFLRVRGVSTGSTPIELEVSLKGSTKTFIRTVEPKRKRGRNMLMRGTQMWAYIPNLKRAVRVSLGQRLSGQAANGDISRMRWAGDYDATIEKQDSKHWTLLLTANKKGLTYAKVRAVIEKGTFHPLYAEYLTSGGKVLKKAQFTAYKELCGKQRPTEIRIQDAVKPDERSVIHVLAMKVKSFPSSMFTPENLR